MDLTYFGHSTFQIETEDVTLLFDPFFEETRTPRPIRERSPPTCS